MQIGPKLIQLSITVCFIPRTNTNVDSVYAFVCYGSMDTWCFQGSKRNLCLLHNIYNMPIQFCQATQNSKYIFTSVVPRQHIGMEIPKKALFHRKIVKKPIAELSCVREYGMIRLQVVEFLQFFTLRQNAHYGGCISSLGVDAQSLKQITS